LVEVSGRVISDILLQANLLSITQAIPVFIGAWMLEMAVKFVKAKKRKAEVDVQLADSATSVYAGLLQETFRYSLCIHFICFPSYIETDFK
jgi:hypothetical protein